MSQDSYTRRQFVQTSAMAAAGGAFLAPKIATGRVSRLATIKVGLVGCGGRGTGAATQALNADPNAVLTAMCDVFPDRLDSSLKRLQNNEAIADKIAINDSGKFTGFDGYKALIDSGVDVVCLATPPVFRPEQLRYAIEADKHVFCEKPVAVDGPGVRSVLETSNMAAVKGLTLVSGFCWRYSIPQRAFWNQILDGGIGQVRSMVTTYNSGPLGDYARRDGESDMEWQLRNWEAFIWTSGDHIVEQAIHAIDWMHWCMNGQVPEKAMAVGGRLCRTGQWTGNIYDHFSVVYEYPDGTRSFHDCRQMPNCWSDNTEKIFGTKGDCYINSWGPTQIITGDNPWEYEGPNPNMYQVEHNELFKAIRNGDLINDGPEMTRSTLMSIMGRMSAYSGQPVTYIEALNSEDRLGPTVYEWSDVPVLEVSVPGSPARWSDVQVASK